MNEHVMWIHASGISMGNSAFHPSGIGKSSTSLHGWG